MVTTAQAASNPDVTNQFICIGEQQVQYCNPPKELLYGSSGIALMLITVRVGLGWAHRSDRSAGGSQHVSASSFIRSAFSRPERHRESLPMHAISLNVSTTVERETDYGLETPGTDHKDPAMGTKDEHGFAV